MGGEISRLHAPPKAVRHGHPSGASVARTILITPKIAAKGSLTPQSQQQEFKNKNLKMTLLVIVLYLLSRISKVEVRLFLIYFWILALQAILLMTSLSF